MMSTTEQELHHFAEFARRRLSPGKDRPSLDELFDEWRLGNPTEADRAENIAAINASIRDFQDGERGTPAGEDSAALRRDFGIAGE